MSPELCGSGRSRRRNSYSLSFRSLVCGSAFVIHRFASGLRWRTRRGIVRRHTAAFARCLADQGRWRPETDVRPHAQVLDAYRDHLNAVRGLSPPTVAQHVSTVAVFLEETLSAGLDVSDLTREQIERDVVATGKRIGRQSLQHWVARLRSFLRFCHMRGLLAVRLDAIDSPRVWIAVVWRIECG